MEIDCMSLGSLRESSLFLFLLFLFFLFLFLSILRRFVCLTKLSCLPDDVNGLNCRLEELSEVMSFISPLSQKCFESSLILFTSQDCRRQLSAEYLSKFAIFLFDNFLNDGKILVNVRYHKITLSEHLGEASHLEFVILQRSG